MNEFLRQLQSDIGRIWSGLSRTQQILFGAVAAVSIAAIVLLLVWARSPEWAPLYTNVTESDAGQIVQKLKDSQVPYEISKDGKSIMVPRSQVHELRLQMAAQGLPLGGEVGFEIFDKNTFGMTEAVQKLNYQRALQGELSRTISRMDGVEQARVHLVIPEPDLFTDTAESPTAAVVIKLFPTSKFSPEQAKTIVHLVSKSVKGLTPANVVITDVNGRNYSDELALGQDNPLSPEQSLKQLELKRQTELGIRKNLQSMLDRVLGPNGAVVNVVAEMDFSQLETNQETFEPVVTGPDGSRSGIMRSERAYSERWDGTAGNTGGVPGTATNIPTYEASASTAAGPGAYEKIDQTRNYEINKSVQRKIKPQAELRRLSVAVAVNGELEEEQIADLRRMISAAAGISEARGDTIVVSALKFNDAVTKAHEEAFAKAEQQAQTQYYLKVAAAILLGIVLLILLRRGLRGRPVDEELPEFAPLTLESTVKQDLAEIGQIGEEDRKTHLQREISKVIKSQPDEVARLVRSWMLEDE